MKILIAEDNAGIRTVILNMLVTWGYEVVTAADGNEAWDKLQGEDAPMLVLLDWMMPGLDGLEICRRLREKKTPVPPYVLFLTCRDNTRDIVTALEAGANDYVTKPFQAEELRARLQVGLRVVELQSALNQRVEELQLERNRAKLCLDVAGVLLIALNEAGAITQVNRKGSEILGYPESEILGRNWFDDFLDQEYRAEARQILFQAFYGNQGRREQLVQKVVTKSGEIRILEIRSGAIQDHTGRVTGVLFSGADVTDRIQDEMALRESEKNYRGLFTQMVNQSGAISTYKTHLTSKKGGS
ncbi:response regulator [Geomesophilobacter sediminis]|uniref:Response regulator n=1 Tax=Geomesophilobacter sediminis TaxID=2798584 RepID=A0A8J7LYA1_9BACT|nr:response regulator [Geomesophilobacter sediminis]MBJ6724666.1 response regulator [Geomesophilobacter sediminis]